MMCVNRPSNLTFPSSDIVSDVGWRASENESVNFRPPEYVLPGTKTRPLAPLQPLRDDRKVRSAFQKRFD